MRYKHAFINASPLACAEPGESQRSLVSPLQPCRITTGGFKGKRWAGLNGPEGWQLSRVCSAKHRISFPADRVAAGEKETPDFFTDAPGDGCIGKTTGGQPHGLQNLQLKQYGFAGHAHPTPVLQDMRST